MRFKFSSMLIFGGMMLCLGELKILDKYLLSNPTTQQQLIHSHDIQQPTQKIIPTPFNHTFNVNAIDSITRTLQINPRCKIIYSTLHKTPLSVHQLLDRSIIEGDAQRQKYFFKDQHIQPEKFAINNQYYLKTHAYKNFHLNKGHMAAAANYSANQSYKSSTFSFANIVPQNAHNNGGIWSTFERYSRNLLINQKCQTVQIISGPIFNTQKPFPSTQNIYINQQLILLKNGVRVPSKLYKIIKCNTKSHFSYASGFIFQNSQTHDNQKNLSSFQSPIQTIQNYTGLTFNFKNNINGPLSSYDQQGLAISKKQYDQHYYNKLFLSSKSINQMSQTLKRASTQHLNLHLIKSTHKNKIQSLANQQIHILKTNLNTSLCQKLSQYLTLHKNLHHLGANHNQFNTQKSQIEQQISTTIQPCHKLATPEQSQAISWKAKYKHKKYQPPFAEQLKYLFPPINNNNNQQHTENKELTTPAPSQTPVPTTVN